MQADDLTARTTETTTHWTANLIRDGLEPVTDHLDADATGRPLFRIHIAVRPDMPENLRHALLQGIGQFLADEMAA